MNQWQKRVRPIRLERRFEFETYAETRDFLDRLGEHTEAAKRFPDISFGRTYVNITLRPEDEEEEVELNDDDYKFAAEIDGLLN
ncbi:MAG: 4a-hydroxytetrahydrobiopterin dehydratase [Prochlorococcus sp. MED-G132]|jgi:pterin-4a-carbinolamine dehydratase|nr:MAG: 4a-hydroxytetrahydrobiopterin dehydratase [Prochlorococcus sp. TMED223]RZO50909.1 MAG: 4a-hydroxytetrahydrobiopterin dehydratase [Prochlorococcus sp. MED-G132]|tara:strand:- start:131 stop:382 length:252 start_codon:yes stop_codon:yes gene_type:complete